MKNLILSLALALSPFALFAQVTSETRTVGEFTGIHVMSMMKVELTQGEACTVVVEAKAKDLSKVSTVVKNGVLNIEVDQLKNLGDIDEDAVVKVTVKNLSNLEVSGASQISSSNQLVCDSLSIENSGASEVKLDVKANVIKTHLSGATNTRLAGTTSVLNAEVSGASELKAYSLAADRVTITASGASSAHVTANKTLNASSSGASDIHYQGEPVEKTVNATGSSSIGMRSQHNNSDTTTVKVGDHYVHITDADEDGEDERSDREKKADDGDFEFWDGFDVGINGYLTQDNKVDPPTGFEYMNLNYAKSYVFGWNVFQKNIHIYRNNVNLGTGLGFTWYHYNFRGSYSLQPNLGYTTAIADSFKYSKNRLNMAYVNVPLFLEFNTNNSDARNSFHIGGGVQIGYNVLSNKLKQRYELNDHTYKNKVRDDFNVNPFRYDVIARIGYGNYTLFGSYSLSTLFEKGKGPTLYPFSAGIHIDFGP